MKEPEYHWGALSYVPITFTNLFIWGVRENQSSTLAHMMLRIDPGILCMRIQSLSCYITPGPRLWHCWTLFCLMVQWCGTSVVLFLLLLGKEKPPWLLVVVVSPAPPLHEICSHLMDWIPLFGLPGGSMSCPIVLWGFLHCFGVFPACWA